MSIHVESQNNGASPFCSLGDKKANEAFAEIIARLRTLGKEAYSPKEKAITLESIIQMLRGWCDLHHLGARNLDDELRIRFLDMLREGQQPPKITYEGDGPLSMRIVPLYAPNLSFHESMITGSGAHIGPNAFVHTLLFVNNFGQIVEFEIARNHTNGAMDFPHVIIVRLVSQEKLATFMAKLRMLFDECIKSLLKSLTEMHQRTLERLDLEIKAINAVTLIGHLQRRDDLVVQIRLYSAEFRDKPVIGNRVERFRQLVSLAGNNLIDRRRNIDEALSTLGWGNADLMRIHGLSSVDELAIMEGPSVE